MRRNGRRRQSGFNLVELKLTLMLVWFPFPVIACLIAAKILPATALACLPLYALLLAAGLVSLGWERRDGWLGPVAVGFQWVYGFAAFFSFTWVVWAAVLERWPDHSWAAGGVCWGSFLFFLGFYSISGATELYAQRRSRRDVRDFLAAAKKGDATEAALVHERGARRLTDKGRAALYDSADELIALLSTPGPIRTTALRKLDDAMLFRRTGAEAHPIDTRVDEILLREIDGWEPEGVPVVLRWLGDDRHTRYRGATGFRERILSAAPRCLPRLQGRTLADAVCAVLLAAPESGDPAWIALLTPYRDAVHELARDPGWSKLERVRLWATLV
jgi:hypothetical protein